MKPVYVPRDPKEKAMQRALMQYFKPYNRQMVVEALKKAGREDLIGWEKDCLITPYERRSANKKTEIGKKDVHKSAKKAENRRESVEKTQRRGAKHPIRGESKPRSGGNRRGSR